MGAESFILLSDSNGDSLMGPLTEIDSFACKKNKMQVGQWSMMLTTGTGQTDEAYSLLSDLDTSQDFIVEYYRRNKALGHRNFKSAFAGRVRGLELAYDSESNIQMSVSGTDGKGILQGAVHNHLSSKLGTVNNYTGQVMRDLVQYNLGSSATVESGRLVNGVRPGVLVGSGRDIGSIIEEDMEGGNIYDLLRSLAEGSQIYFDMLYQGGGQWLFETYNLLRGFDLTVNGYDETTKKNQSGQVPVIFATHLGNMLNPVWTEDLDNQINSVTAVGATEGDAEAVLNYTAQLSSAVQATPYSQTELFVKQAGTSLSAVQTTAELNLQTLQTGPKLYFDFVEQVGSVYDVDFGLGDITTSIAFDKQLDQDLQSIEISLDPQKGEEISLSFIDLPSTYVERSFLYADTKIKNMERRIQRLGV